MSTVEAGIFRSQTKNLVSYGRSSTIVPIQEDGSRHPLYLIHAVDGEIDCYYPLAHALGLDRPIYAVQFTGLEVEHPQGIDAIARAYLRDLRALNPVGPYILGGYSFGGNIAFEMAKLLSDEGEEPLMVVMFDSGIPSSTRRVGLREKAGVLLQNWRTGGIDYFASRKRIKWRYWKDVAKKKFLALAGSVFHRLGQPRPSNLRRAQAELANRRAIAAYRPSNYYGRVLLISCANRYETLSNREDPLLGWGAFAGSDFEICAIPTDHTRLMKEPAIQIVAERLRECLDSIVP